MTQVDFNVIVAITSIGIWSKIIQTHFLLTQDLIITSSIIHSCSENAFLQCCESDSRIAIVHYLGKPSKKKSKISDIATIRS